MRTLPLGALFTEMAMASASSSSPSTRLARSRYSWPTSVSAKLRVVRFKSLTPRWSSRSDTARVTTAGARSSVLAAPAKLPSAMTWAKTRRERSWSMRPFFHSRARLHLRQQKPPLPGADFTQVAVVLQGLDGAVGGDKRIAQQAAAVGAVHH